MDKTCLEPVKTGQDWTKPKSFIKKLECVYSRACITSHSLTNIYVGLAKLTDCSIVCSIQRILGQGNIVGFSRTSGIGLWRFQCNLETWIEHE